MYLDLDQTGQFLFSYDDKDGTSRVPGISQVMSPANCWHTTLPLIRADPPSLLFAHLLLPCLHDNGILGSYRSHLASCLEGDRPTGISSGFPSSRQDTGKHRAHPLPPLPTTRTFGLAGARIQSPCNVHRHPIEQESFRLEGLLRQQV